MKSHSLRVIYSLFGCIYVANKNNSVGINWHSALEALLKCVFSFFNAKNRENV